MAGITNMVKDTYSAGLKGVNHCYDQVQGRGPIEPGSGRASEA